MILQTARSSIGAYDPADPREREFKARMLQLLELQAPFSRNYFAPGHLTASAFVLSPEADAVLLILHRKLGIWVQPGGHIEASDESLLAAARRELAEEVGVELPLDAAAAIFDLDVHRIPPRQDQPGHEHFDVRFCFHAPTRSFVASDEVADARWVDLSRIDQVTTDESVLRVARKLLSCPSTRR